MTPAAKATYLTALLLGLFVGFLQGYRQTSNGLNLIDETRFVTGPFALEDFSLAQYAHADSEHGRAALVAYANLLETMQKAKAEKPLMSELRNVYMRLAMLEDTENNPEQSHAYMTKARYWNSAAGDRDYSESEESGIKAVLKKLDALR